MHQLSIVALVGRTDPRALDRFVAAVAGSASRDAAAAEIVLVADDAAGLDHWRPRAPELVRRVRGGTIADGIASARGEWAMVADPSQPLPAGALRRLRRFLARPDDPSVTLVCTGAAPAGVPAAGPDGARRLPVDRLEVPPSAHAACVRRTLLAAAAANCGTRLRPDFAAVALMAHCLLGARGGTVAWLGGASGPPADGPTAGTAWDVPATYVEAIAAGPLALLEAARASGGQAPAWLRRAVLDELCRYFAADMQPRSPTATVSEATATAFHDLVRRVVAFVGVDAVERLDAAGVDADVRHALLSYLPPRTGRREAVAVVDHDAEQALARLSWHVHGRAPAEAFLLDGEPVMPAHAKYRNCRFFRRTLCRERIVWLPVAGARMLAVRLDGQPVALSIGRPHGSGPAPTGDGAGGISLDSVRAAFAPGAVAAPAGLAALKALVLRRLAVLPSVRRRYAGAWVFIDREDEADDNAEHQYRWTRRHHPGINAWFLLDRGSPHWERLQREGFRLMPPGLARRFLVLNAEHLLSSQPAHVHAGFDPALHGGRLPWRFTFLQHGVIMNDLSHWLNGKPFDVFVTSSPAEEQAIGGDDTPYTFTTREVRRTGLSRHDRLLELATGLPAQGIDTILLMPTWRGRLSGQGTDERARAAFRDSDYARAWRSLLADEALRRVAERHGKRIVFMPHPDSAPFVDAFEAPAHVEVATKAATGIQPLFARSAAMVTDYSSVAFEMAFLRRPVVYFQFDRDTFFAGGHNWREGYFDFERDGFGPVAPTPGEVVQALDRLLVPGAAALDGYVARMERTLPERDGGACRRVHEAVTGIRCRRAAGTAPAARRDAPPAGADARTDALPPAGMPARLPR